MPVAVDSDTLTKERQEMLERLRTLSLERGRSLGAVCDETHIGKNFVSNINGGAGPSKKNLAILAEYFNVTVEYILGQEDDTARSDREVQNMLDWLRHHQFKVEQDSNGNYIISKNGKTNYYQLSELQRMSRRISLESQNWYDLAMTEWENQQYLKSQPISIYSLNPEERAIIEAYRNCTDIAERMGLYNHSQQLPSKNALGAATTT